MLRLRIRRPDDFHFHPRMGKILHEVILYTVRVFARGLPMPNTVRPLLEAIDALVYRDYILKYLGKSFDFTVVMAIKMTARTTRKMLIEAFEAGVKVVKLYPEGVTTNSADGVRDFTKLYHLFRVMERLGMILSIHGEMPVVDPMQSERAFLPVLIKIHRKFPNLKIVLEHVSTAEGVEVVKSLGQTVAATIAIPYLVLTTSNVLGRPHNYSKPAAQSRFDRAAVLAAATSGNPKFFFGSDSAPHSIEAKECAEGAAGVFSAPVALPLLAQIFERAGALDKLEDFVSRFGAEFYGLPLNEGTIELVKKPWLVPARIGNFVPFMAGETIDWQIAA